MDSNIDRISRGLAGTTSRRQAFKMLGGSLLGGALAGAGFAVAKDAAAQGGPPAQGSGLPVFTDGTQVGTISDLQAFLNDDGTLGLSGTFTNLADAVDTFVTSLNVSPDEAVCDVLYLQLGPLDLDVLGVVVNLDTITLNVDAVPGAGNLLGNLLCAVTNLLNNPSEALNGVVNLLNRIFSILG